MVKSYNARRGFGFVACEETALKYGRDVYIAKAEAQAIFMDDTTRIMDRKTLPALEEEDLIRFRVRLSSEGYPQAVQIMIVRKFQGIVLEAPGEISEATPHPSDGRIVSDELAMLFGHRGEAILKRASCGRARLAVGDRVTFCVPDTFAHDPEAKREVLLGMLMPRPVHHMNSILACCVLNLPRMPLRPGWPARADLNLDCHALGDRIMLSGLPQDVDEAELMRFFVKHGATVANVAMSRGSTSFASIGFPSMSEVSRFVARARHTFADDKETRLATLMPHLKSHSHGDHFRLPGLPAPQLTPGSEVGVLLVSWSPVVLATGYAVEVRPAGVQAEWSMVDAADGQLGSANAARFDKDSYSCQVSGLPNNIVFEARIIYHTSCGCKSDASDNSEWCMAVPRPAQQEVNPPGLQGHLGGLGNFQLDHMTGGGAGFNAGAAAAAVALGIGLPGGWPSDAAAVLKGQQAGLAEAWPGAWPGGSPAQLLGGMQTAGWRCIHGAVLPPPTTPELRPADDYGFSILVQWPSVAHATAYVVELRESGSSHAERFVRNLPMQAVGSIVELRIGGLRPSGGLGRVYVAQIRSVGACGCESEPSPPGTSQPLGASPQAPLTAQVARAQTAASQPAGPLPMLSLATACAAPNHLPEPSKLEPWQAQVSQSSYTGGTASDGLPSLLQSSKAPPVPPPAGLPELATNKELPPEVAGNEDCIILD